MLFLIAVVLLTVGCSGGFNAPTSHTFPPAGKITHDLPDSLISDISPPEGFNIRIRMSEQLDALWPREKNHIIGRALDKWESIIVERPTSDRPISGQSLGWLSWAEFTEPDSVYFGEYELEILIDYDNSPGWAGAQAIRLNDEDDRMFIKMSAMAVGRDFMTGVLDGSLNDDQIYLIFLHEFGHALGFGMKDNPPNQVIRGRFGNRCLWRGANAMAAWNKLMGVDTHSFVPLQLGCGHWDHRDPDWKKVFDVMYPTGYKSNISSVTIGYFDDLGFGVNYEAAEDIVRSRWGVRPAGKAIAMPEGFEFECMNK